MGKYTFDQGFAILRDTVSRKRRHPNYKRTVDLAKYYKQLTTGEDQRELIVQFKSRESEEQKEQRYQLTNTRTASTANLVAKTFERAYQSDKITNKIEAEDNVKAELEERLDVYYAGASLEKYLNSRFLYYNMNDPNAFLITEFTKETDELGNPTEKPYTYPFEASAEQVINFNYINGVLDWIIIKHDIKILDKEGKEKDGEKYYFYAADIAIVLTEVTEDTPAEEGQRIESIMMDKDAKTFYVAPEVTATIDRSGKETRYFIYGEFETQSKEVPAIRFGYILDAVTNNETCVGILECARSQFNDLINDGSMYAITKALHAFMQKYQYIRRCTNESVPEGTCKNGIMSISNKQCSACNGKGWEAHISAQDIVYIKMPDFDDGESFIPIQQLANYVDIPFDIVEHQRTAVKEAPDEIEVAIFGAVQSKQQGGLKTAEEINDKATGLYAVLGQFGAWYSTVYEKQVNQTAIYMEVDEGVEAEYSFPKDFKLLSLGELAIVRKQLVESGSPYQILRNVDLDILSKQNVGNPVAVSWMEAIEDFKPWRSKSSNEIAMITVDLPEDDYDLVLWMNFDKIFTEVEYEEPEFYAMPFDKRQTIVDTKVNAIQEQIRGRRIETPTSTAALSSVA